MAKVKRPLKHRRRNAPHEYIALIGAPSNTFNGYFHYNILAQPIAEPKPLNTSDAEIARYIRGVDNGPIHALRTVTHDLYWANFLYSAVKAVETGNLRPAAGDILTFILWMPGLFSRIHADWAASPYNTEYHLNSPWVAGNKPYKRSVQSSQQGQLIPYRRPDLPDEPVITFATFEPEIDHEILMRTTSEGDADGGFHKRAHANDDYERAISDIPRRLAFGSSSDAPFATPLPVTAAVPTLFDVQIKLLFMTQVNQLFDYLKLGTWPAGERLVHYLEIEDELHTGDGNSMEDCTYAAFGKRTRRRPSPYWSDTPAVDRTSVKIKRFDYFGHSGPGTDQQTQDAFWLGYGLTNGKGNPPSKELSGIVDHTELQTHLSQNLFADGALGRLWGCRLGRFMAPMLASFMNNGEVWASEGLTSFDHILDDGTGLPVPANAGLPFNRYPGP